MEISFEKYLAQLASNLAVQEKPSILLLTCMDYRYAHRITDFMDNADPSLRRKYDMFVLAGAAAGANRFPNWRKALVEHIKTARDIDHPIDRLIILEHRDCGAYKAFLGLDWSRVTPPDEWDSHKNQVTQLITTLRGEIQNLTIDSFLLTRDEDDVLYIAATDQ
jgi:carbonic anhydrase